MLGPVEIAALVTATKGAVELFDRMAGQVKTVLEKRPREAEGEEDRWRYRITGQDGDIVVKQNNRTIQTLTHEELAKKLSEHDLRLVITLEEKMNEYYRLWRAVYGKKDSSQDPLVNAQTDLQLEQLIKRMRNELVGILSFLQTIGVHLDDHYMHVRYLIQEVK